jgi:hypothetical protein
MWSEGSVPNCAIGVVGWLLTCRQSYVEGIEVLYSTNTFIESPVLFDALFCPGPRTRHLILPQRLASIASLELRWERDHFDPFSGENQRGQVGADRRAVDRERLASYLRNLGGTFPNLRRLVLYVWQNFYWDAIDQVDRVLLRPLADAVACLPWLQQQPVTIIVELPYNVFNQLRSAAAGYQVGRVRRGK